VLWGGPSSAELQNQVIVSRDGFGGVSNTNSSFVPNPKNEKYVYFRISYMG
jgi:hypothetical protein